MSNQRTFIVLGKTGDICSILPLVQSQIERAAIMVATEFMPLMEGVGYCDVIEFRGTHNELRRAIGEARKLSNDVRACSIGSALSETDAKELLYATVGQEHAVTESFDKEAWKLGGALLAWYKNRPLVFDRRNAEREAALIDSLSLPANKRIILASFGGVSSPFKYKKLVMHLLESRFRKGYHILDMDDVQAERFYDLVALYERAHCLVATDSAPLHLANAVQTLPVVALVNDRPNLWSGSAWRPQHIRHIRYSDTAARAVEIVEAIEGI